jgi:hypothetical protein
MFKRVGDANVAANMETKQRLCSFQSWNEVNQQLLREPALTDINVFKFFIVPHELRQTLSNEVTVLLRLFGYFIVHKVTVVRFICVDHIVAT